MKNISKFLTLLGLMSFCISACGKNSAKATDANEQGLDFYLLDDGTYGVGIGTAGLLKEITVPSTYNGKKVTKVVEKGFEQMSLDDHFEYQYTKINLPNTILEIDDYAFTYSHLEYINIPASVKRIGEDSFRMDDNDNERTITMKYESTFSDFNKIEFGERWVNYSNSIIFDCSDQKVNLQDLFDTLIVKRYVRFDDQTHQSIYEEVGNEMSRSYRNKDAINFSCYIRTSYFGGIETEADNKEVENSNPSAVSLSGDNNYNYFSLTPNNPGSSDITIRSGKASFKFKFNSKDDVIATVNEALNILKDFDENQKSEDCYSITGYVKEVDSSLRILQIVDNIGDEKYLSIYTYSYPSYYTFLSSLVKDDKIQVIGNLFNYYGNSQLYLVDAKKL